jgi:hypothetical protein
MDILNAFNHAIRFSVPAHQRSIFDCTVVRVTDLITGEVFRSKALSPPSTVLPRLEESGTTKRTLRLLLCRLASLLVRTSTSLARAKKVPDRMWHNGIYGLLELRRRHSMHYSLAFLRLAYSMVGFIRECTPSNEDHLWTELLGDLARCYWEILREDADDSKR